METVIQFISTMTPYELSRVTLHAAQVLATVSIPFVVVFLSTWLKARKAKQPVKYKYKYKYTANDIPKEEVKAAVKKVYSEREGKALSPEFVKEAFGVLDSLEKKK